VSQPRIVVIGTGSFGRNHLRVVHQSTQAGLSGVFDTDEARAAEAAKNFNCRIFSSLEEAAQESDAAIVATPTTTHADIGCRLMERGLDVLVEKPIAHSLEFGERLVETAERCGKILQVGHLERFNPAVLALEKVVTKPMFFEIHRLSEFSPRSLDVDVVLDLMIHDIDIILALSGLMPEEIRAAGISILSEKVDIANVRLQFPGGCIANLTASRVSTERVRKLRTADASALCAAKNGPPMKIDFAALPIEKDEPLRLELEDFFSVVQTRQKPRSSGRQALAALQVAHGILVKIEEHARLVAEALSPH
jgi:predicted dehydrogenase